MDSGWMAFAAVMVLVLTTWLVDRRLGERMDRMEKRLDGRVDDVRDSFRISTDKLAQSDSSAQWRLDSLARSLGWKYVPEGKTLAKWERDDVPTGPTWSVVGQAFPSDPPPFSMAQPTRVNCRICRDSIVGCPCPDCCKARKPKPPKRKRGA